MTADNKVYPISSENEIKILIRYGTADLSYVQCVDNVGSH